MKKCSLAALVSIFVFIFVFIIPNSVFPNQFGLKVGVNFAEESPFELNLGEDPGIEPRLTAGVFYRFDLSKRLSIQPEVFFSRISAKILYKESGYDYDWEVDLTVIEIPVLLKYKILTRGKILPRVYLGPSYVIKTSARSVITQFGHAEDHFPESFEGKHFEFQFGGSVEFRTGAGSLIFDARYIMGEDALSDTKVNSFTILLGYGFK